MTLSERYRIGYVLTKRIPVFDLFREYARQDFANQVFKLVLYNELMCQLYFHVSCSSRGIEFVKLDIGNLAQDQGFFDIIIHKVTKLLIFFRPC